MKASLKVTTKQPNVDVDGFRLQKKRGFTAKKEKICPYLRKGYCHFSFGCLKVNDFFRGGVERSAPLPEAGTPPGHRKSQPSPAQAEGRG